MYRGGNKGLFVLLNRTQAGPGRTVKQEQEESAPNHVQRLNLIVVKDIEMERQMDKGL